MVNIVSFDMVGTLVDSNFEDYVWNVVIPQLCATKRGISFKEATEYVLREYNFIGNKDLRWYQPTYWFKRFNLDEDSMEVFTSHTNKVRFFPETIPVLKKLSQKYDLIIVSGTTRDIIEIMIERVRSYFKHIFSPISDRYEVRKEPELYKMICKKLKVEPDTIAHVGDDWYSDFISPRKFGIKSFYLDRDGEKRGEFIIRNLFELEDRLTKLET
ncbi:MAG: HAD family hydrolase [Promethearchaeota archaeon]